MKKSEDNLEERLDNLWEEIVQIAQELSFLEYEAKRAAGKLEAKKEILSKRLDEFTNIVTENPELEDKEVKPSIKMPDELFSLTHDNYQKVIEIVEDLEKEYENGAPIKAVKGEARTKGENIQPEFVEEVIKLEIENGRIKPTEVKDVSGSIKLSKK